MGLTSFEQLNASAGSPAKTHWDDSASERVELAQMDLGSHTKPNTSAASTPISLTPPSTSHIPPPSPKPPTGHLVAILPQIERVFTNICPDPTINIEDTAQHSIDNNLIMQVKHLTEVFTAPYEMDSHATSMTLPDANEQQDFLTKLKILINNFEASDGLDTHIGGQTDKVGE